MPDIAIESAPAPSRVMSAPAFKSRTSGRVSGRSVARQKSSANP